MFDINNIQYNPTTKQYICCCPCGSSQDAKYICAKYITVARTFDPVGEINNRGSTAIIGASNQNAATNIASYINANYFMPPLDIYVFYGSSQKSLESRWCVGFDYPKADRLIEMLNAQGRLVVADKDPRSWITTEGNSYSVVLLPGVLKPEQSSELEQRVDLCLRAIQNVTARSLNKHYL